MNMRILDAFWGAAVAKWLSSWLAKQEDRGSIPGLATWIFRDWLSPASKSRYGWKIAKSTLILKTTNKLDAFLLGNWRLGWSKKIYMHYKKIYNVFISYRYSIRKKNWHVPHLKCVKNKFHNKRNDTEPRYKSKSHAIYVFVDLHLADNRRIYILYLKHKDISKTTGEFI